MVEVTFRLDDLTTCEVLVKFELLPIGLRCQVVIRFFCVKEWLGALIQSLGEGGFHLFEKLLLMLLGNTGGKIDYRIYGVTYGWAITWGLFRPLRILNGYLLYFWVFILSAHVWLVLVRRLLYVCLNISWEHSILFELNLWFFSCHLWFWFRQILQIR